MRMNIALASVEDLVPKKAGQVARFHITKSHHPFTAPGSVYIPHQVDGKSTEMSFVMALQVTGWDWRPERMSWSQRRNVWLFCNTPSQYPEDIDEKIRAHGYEIIEIEVTEQAFSDLMYDHGPATTTPSPIDLCSYNRTRFLWKNHNAQFNTFEQSFIKNVGDRLQKNKPLTEPQRQTLLKIFNKYKVPFDATAAQSYGDDDLTTLRSIAPNIRQDVNFSTEDNTHYQSARHTNDLGQARKTNAKKTISARKRKIKKDQKKYKKDQSKLKLEIEAARVKPDSPAVTDKATSNSLPSAMAIGDHVSLKLQQIKLDATVMAVTFTSGKVLYNLAVYTGDDGLGDKEMADRWGQINTIGWDEQGKCYIRLANVDSTLVEPVAGWPPMRPKAGLIGSKAGQPNDNVAPEALKTITITGPLQ